MSSKPDLTIVVACDSAKGIGLNNDLPWRLPSDLKYFYEITKQTSDQTKQNAVIMGRKTWESIPENHRPLKDRINIVISRQTNYPLPTGVHLANSFDEALQIAKENNVETIHNIGGAQIFTLGLQHPDCNIAYITELEGEFACDTFLATLPKGFQRVAESNLQTENGINYKYVTYRLVK